MRLLKITSNKEIKEEIIKKKNSLREQLIMLSEQKEEKQKAYIQNIDAINVKLGTIKKMHYDFKFKIKDAYQNMLQRSKYLQRLITRKDTKYNSFFLTITLPTEYHPYINNNTEYNPRYDKSLTIEDGYKKLQRVFRGIHKDLWDTKYNKKVNLEFIKVIEPHKTFVPHLHAVFFVPERLSDKFLKHVARKISNNKVVIEENKYKYIDNNRVGRCELEAIEDINKVVAYLFKYIRKTFNPETDQDYHALNGWKKVNRITTFTMTRVSMPRFISKPLYRILGKKIDKTKEDYNILEELESMCNIQVRYYNDDDKPKFLNSKYYGTKRSKYNVKIKIHKIPYIVYENNFINYKGLFRKKDFNLQFVFDIDPLLQDCCDYESCDYIVRPGYTMYKVVSFIIIDNTTKKIIYDKSDYKYVNHNL